MPGGRDSGGPVDVDPDVVVPAERSLAGVQAHPNADRAGWLGPPVGRQRSLRGGRRLDGPFRAREDDEERIAFGRDLHAAGGFEGRAQQALVIFEDGRVAIPEGRHEESRALDVREEKRHVPSREDARHGRPGRRPASEDVTVSPGARRGCCPRCR